MLASTYNAGSMLCSDYGPLEWIGGHDSGVYRGRGADGRYVALRFCAIDSGPARSALIETVYTASLLRHPMLTAVAGCQSYAGGALCLVSEYVPGQNLDRWVTEQGRPELRITIDFIRRLCLGLHAAHQRGLTHHALHPGNLMVLQPDTQRGGRIVAKLLDLGVPAFVRPWPPRAAAIPYTAPELLDSDEPTAPIITPGMNVYSAGALLHYLCTGAPPQRDAGGRLTGPAIHQLNPEIPELLERVILACLAVDPQRRPASAAELAAALGRVESEWRISGVRRRETPTGEGDASQFLGGERESQTVLHTRPSRPPAASSFRSSGARPRGPATTDIDRVRPHVPRPPTGSYPRIELPVAQRWAAVLVLVALLTLYFAWLPSSADRVPPPMAAGTSARELHRTDLSSESAPTDSAPALELHRADLPLEPAPIEPPTVLEPRRIVATPSPAPEPTATPAKSAGRQRRLRASQPTAAGHVHLHSAPSIPPAPLPVILARPDAPPQPAPRDPRPRLASGSETTQAPPSTTAGTSPTAIEVQVASVNVRGSLTVSVVRRAIERIRPMLTQCYRRYLRPGQSTYPALRVSATIDEVGRVRSPSVEGGTVPALNECVVKVTSKMVSDAPDTGIVRASWRLSL